MKNVFLMVAAVVFLDFANANAATATSATSDSTPTKVVVGAENTSGKNLTKAVDTDKTKTSSGATKQSSTKPKWAVPPVKKAFFWEIEKNGKYSYLLGTQHLGVDFYQLPKFVRQVYFQANIVGTEMQGSFFNFLWEALAPNMREHYSKVKLVDQMRSPEAKVEVAKVIKELEKDDPDAAYLKPWAFFSAANAAFVAQANASLLTKYNMPLMDMMLAIGGANQMDFDWESWSWKRVSIGLESGTELNDNFERNIQAADIERWMLSAREDGGATMVVSPEVLEKQLRDLSDLYVEGEIAPYDEICSKDVGTIPAVFKNRNELFAPRIETQHFAVDGSNKPRLAFFAVGLCHLLGDDSLLDQLVARGFSVRRIAVKEDWIQRWPVVKTSPKPPAKKPLATKPGPAPSSTEVKTKQNMPPQITKPIQDVNADWVEQAAMGELEAIIGTEAMVAMLAGAYAFAHYRVPLLLGSGLALSIALDGECRLLLVANNKLGGDPIPINTVALQQCADPETTMNAINRVMDKATFNTATGRDNSGLNFK